MGANMPSDNSSRLLYSLKSRGPLATGRLARALGITVVGIRQHLAMLSIDQSSNFSKISRKRNITRARRNGGCEDHSGKAAAAAATARSISASLANGTRDWTWPDAG